MDQIGLIDRVYESVYNIENGRKWLHTEGLEGKGRISYRDGLNMAMEAFDDAQILAASDLATLIHSEITFITQELQFCAPSDTQASSSLKQAIQNFDDSLLALQAVESGDAYRIADLTYPHQGKYRYKEMPKDSFHIACISHRTRISNILRSPGINMAEKELLTKRQSNLASAQAAYLTKQKAALFNDNETGF